MVFDFSFVYMWIDCQFYYSLLLISIFTFWSLVIVACMVFRFLEFNTLFPLYLKTWSGYMTTFGWASSCVHVYETRAVVLFDLI